MIPLLRSSFGITLGLFALAATAQPASNSTSTEPPPEYAATIERALAEYDAGNFAEARALFGRAHELFPNARTLRGLGVVEFELKNYADAADRLQAALDSKIRPLDGAMRAEVEELLARSRLFVAHLELAIMPDVPETRVLLDGVEVADRSKPVWTLTVGEHVIQVQAPGFEPETRRFCAKGGEQRRLLLELQKVAVAGPVLATREAPARRDARSLWASPWLWTGVGLAVVGAIVTTVLLSQGSKTVHPIAGDVGGVVQASPRP